MSWSDLDRRSDSKTRFCQVCTRDVHLVENDEQFVQRVKAGDCIAVLYEEAGSYSIGEAALPYKIGKWAEK